MKNFFLYASKSVEMFSADESQKQMDCFRIRFPDAPTNPVDAIFWLMDEYMFKMASEQLKQSMRPSINAAYLWVENHSLVLKDVVLIVLGIARNMEGDVEYYTAMGTVTVKR